MVIKGGSKGHAAKLAAHLVRTDQNDRVEIIELDQTAASPTIDAVLREYQTLAETLTRSKKGLYEASINPTETDKPLSREQWIEAADSLEKQLGLDGQPRVIVLHEKQGREHIHVVWQRTDIEYEIVIDDGWNYRNHELAAREIEQKFDLEITPGVHTKEPDEPRPDRATELWEHQQANRTGLDPADRKTLMKELFERSDNARAFTAALEDSGYHLARGDDKNIFMVVDPAGEEHSLTRELTGYRKKDVEAKMAPLSPENFRTVSEVKTELERPAAAPQQADTIAAKFADQKAELEKDRNTAIRRREATHSLFLERRARLHQTEKPTGFKKLLENVTGLAWLKEKLHERETREILAQQRQDLSDLKRFHQNRSDQLERDRRAELHDLNQDLKPDNPPLRSRFQLRPDEAQVAKVEASLLDLRNHDRAAIDKTEVDDRLKSTRAYIKKIERRQLYLETLDCSVAEDFAKIYRDGETALQAFLQTAEDLSVQKAIDKMKKRPDTFGELKPTPRPLDRLADLQTASTDAKKAYYLRTKIEHEITGLPMLHTSVRLLQEKKMDLEHNHGNERLALLRLLQNDSTKLPKEQYKELQADDRRAIDEARRLMRENTNRQRADQYLEEMKRQAAEKRKEQEQFDLRR